MPVTILVQLYGWFRMLPRTTRHAERKLTLSALRITLIWATQNTRESNAAAGRAAVFMVQSRRFQKTGPASKVDLPFEGTADRRVVYPR